MVQHCLLDSTLEQSRRHGSGMLIGWQPGQGGEITVVDVVHLDASQPPSSAALDAVRHALPQGLSYVGVYASDRQAATALASLPATQQLLAPATPAAVLTLIISAGSCDYAWYDAQAGTWTAAEVNQRVPRTEALAWPGQPIALCSAQLNIPLDIYTTLRPLPATPGVTDPAVPASDAQALAQGVRAAETALCQSLSNTCASFVITCKSGQVLVSGSSKGTLADLAPPVLGLRSSALIAQPLRTGQAAQAVQGEALQGPVYEYQVASAGTLAHQRAALRVSALAYVPVSTPLADLSSTWLLPGLLRAVRAAAAVIVSQGQVVDVTAHHFQPPGRSHHVMLAYPQLPASGMDKLEASLAPLRRELHGLLGLPPNRPCLRVANAVAVQGEGSDVTWAGSASAAAQRLKDVHLGLVQPVAGGTVSMLEGSYDYHHYMQDRFNDNGWGCAYRSLQTIVSWFRLQQYTSKPVPSHREVQQMLVRMGDKSSDFIGSTNWIGAIELSYILDEYLGVTSKIITVNKGSDIPSYARQLAAHFTSQGTPVMIGGGVLAYTLLGVSFDEVTGDSAFLILDPHYTGGEELRKIQAGTWVAWKKTSDNAAAGGPLFVHDAFYNFLCPQRPQQV